MSKLLESTLTWIPEQGGWPAEEDSDYLLAVRNRENGYTTIIFSEIDFSLEEVSGYPWMLKINHHEWEVLYWTEVPWFHHIFKHMK